MTILTGHLQRILRLLLLERSLRLLVLERILQLLVLEVGEYKYSNSTNVRT